MANVSLPTRISILLRKRNKPTRDQNRMTGFLALVLCRSHSRKQMSVLEGALLWQSERGARRKYSCRTSGSHSKEGGLIPIPLPQHESEVRPRFPLRRE